ncbi:hypothetical protein RDp07_gp11 [Roseobacter phage RD-1410Ws-07]|uniref:Uncharacterized protein n=1 Tax=Roseobacter phage RD-1410Ws-07 TaxID=1815985 RepID=A0A191VYM8_9CAUD|nr:hypothetical protein RDp07_gp11 [Roseobacter phage RD-1410Ws-07]
MQELQESMTDHMRDALLYGHSMGGRGHAKTATQMMMEESARVYQQKYATGTVTGRMANPLLQGAAQSLPLRPPSTAEFAFPASVFQTEHQRLMMMPDEIVPPTTVQQDRHYLCMTVAEYQDFSECIQTSCYLNKQGQHCKLKNAKTKKLKNLRYSIRKAPYLMASLIWQAQLRIIENEISKRRGVPRHEKP